MASRPGLTQQLCHSGRPNASLCLRSSGPDLLRLDRSRKRTSKRQAPRTDVACRIDRQSAPSICAIMNHAQGRDQQIRRTQDCHQDTLPVQRAVSPDDERNHANKLNGVGTIRSSHRPRWRIVRDREGPSAEWARSQSGQRSARLSQCWRHERQRM